jgi:hypothetical protein
MNTKNNQMVTLLITPNNTIFDQKPKNYDKHNYSIDKTQTRNKISALPKPEKNDNNLSGNELS